MDPRYQKILDKAARQYKATRQFLKRLRKKPPKDLDEQCQAAHEEAFQEINCLSCANCCKTMSPRVTEKDARRIAKVLGITPKAFIATYLYEDEEGDYLMREAPCPFLGTDNKCLIYEDRPSACADFPHTNHRKMRKHLNTAAHNYTACPIVFKVIESIKAQYTAY